jgi:hypothetical protein
MQISQAAISHKTGEPVHVLSARMGVKYQPENERPNRRSEIGAAKGVLTAWQISMSDDNAKLDRAEALAVIIAQAFARCAIY